AVARTSRRCSASPVTRRSAIHRRSRVVSPPSRRGSAPERAPSPPVSPEPRDSTMSEAALSSQGSASDVAARRALFDPPGGVLMWIVVGLELSVFALIFFFIAHLRVTEPALFASGQAALDPMVGLGLTIALVTSGWLAAEAVHAYRGGDFTRARRFYA